MFYINSIDRPRPAGLGQRLKLWTIKAGSTLEALLILGLWLAAFTKDPEWIGLGRQEIIAYLLIGNIIGALTNYLLYRLISDDLRREKPELLLYHPLRYLSGIVFRRLIKNFIPFSLAIGFQVFLLYFLVGWENIEIKAFSVVWAGTTVLLAFITELFLAYLLNIYIFWSIRSPEIFHIALRLKKALAGNYFPLSVLPATLAGLSLFFPFAYAFYVPAQIFLGQMPASFLPVGLAVQSAWIIIMYVLIRLLWGQKKARKL